MSIPHRAQPAEEGAQIVHEYSTPPAPLVPSASPAPPVRLALPVRPAPPAPSFAVKRAEFEAHKSQARQQARETQRIAETHIRTLKTRLFHAEEELALGHTGLAAAHLMIGSRDLEAALAALPQL